jgi:hypothetical protein
MRTNGFQAIYSAFIIAFSAGVAFAGPTDAEKCEATKNKIAGKYAFCRAKAEAKAIKKGIAPDYTKCDAQLGDKWTKAELPAACLDAVSATAIQDFVTASTDAIAGALVDGGVLPECGDDSVNVAGEQCDGSDLDGYSCASLGHLGGSLGCDASCNFDVSGCADCFSLGGVDVGGFCWFLGTATDCNATCASAGLTYSAATLTYAGSSGTLAQCYEVMDALGQTSPPFTDVGDLDCLSNANIAVSGIGCAVTGPSFPLRIRCTATPTVASASHSDLSRACACE